MQERERVRERHPDREARRHDYDWNEARAERWAKEKKLFAEAPRVVKYDSVPWEQVHQAYHKIFSGDNLPDIDRKLRRAPLYTMSARLQILDTGRKSGNHRHYFEAIFFVLEGKGHEVHDERRWEWEPGDAVLVPAYCTHQHFCDEGPSTLFYVVGGFTAEAGLGTIEQVELHPDFSLPEGASLLYDNAGRVVGYRRRDNSEILFHEYAVGKSAMERRFQQSGPPSHEVTDHYEYYLRLLEEERHARLSVPHVIKQSSLKWEDTRNGRIKWILHPQLGQGMRQYECYLQEIPPGGRSGKHFHVGEEIHYIMEGEGYDVIDDRRWDWNEKDVVTIPVLSTHQTFNSGNRPMKMLVVKTQVYDHMGFGGIEHLEDASG